MVNLFNVLLLNVPFLFELHQIWSFESHENHQNCCHQMSDFKAKMHQIRFRLGLAPDPAAGAYSAPPDPLAGFKGPTSKEGEGREGRKGKVDVGRGMEE